MPSLRPLVLLVLLLGAAPAAWAGDPAEDAAVRAKAAHEAGQTEALAGMANAQSPDPWAIVESLMETDGEAAAKALAAARKAGDREALTAYVAWRAKNPVPKAEHTALRKDEDGGDPVKRLARLDRLLEKGRGVTYVLLAGQRVQIVFQQQRPPAELLAAMTAEGDAAYAIGWDARAHMVYRAAFERHFLLSEPERIIAMGLRLLEIAERGGVAPMRSDAHMCVARALEMAGRADEALVHARKGVELAPTPIMKRNGTRLVVLMHMVLGNRHAALRHLEELYELDKALRDQHGARMTEMHIASYEAQLGQSAKAVARITEVLEYAEKYASNMQRRGVHMQAASIWRELRDPARSIEHISAARAAEQAARDAGEPSRVSPHQLDAIEALNLVELGRYEEAETIFRRIVEQRTKTTRAARLFDHMSLGSVLARQGKHEEAATVYEAGSAHLSDQLSADIRAKWHQSRSQALLRAGKLDEAAREATLARTISEEGLQNELHSSSAGVLARIAYARGDMPEAVRFAEEMLALTIERSASLPERSGAAYRAEFADTARVGVEAAARGGDATRLFHLAERVNAVALRGRLGPRDVMATALPPALRERERELQEAEAQAVITFRHAKDGTTRRSALKTLSSVREDLDRHRERMHAERAAAAYVLEPAADTLADTQGRLGADEALVLFLTGEAHAWALVVTQKSTRTVKLMPRVGLSALLREVVPEDPRAGAKDIVRLRTALVDPLALPASVKDVTVVPAGPLAFVPFGALLPKRVVTLLPSVTAGRLLAARALAGEGTLAVGDPESRDGRRLPGAREEAQAVGDVTLLGKAATEAGIAKALAKRKRWRALHLGCHGLIDPTHPLRSALSLTPTEDADGLWTVSEILTTNVAVDAAVLGSCSTGRGRAYDQDGVLGFVHAFFVAGARHVIVSLWDVDDKATSALLKRFHEEWKGDVSPAAALARAQAWMRTGTEWKQPAHWAGWQIWGPAD